MGKLTSIQRVLIFLGLTIVLLLGGLRLTASAQSSINLESRLSRLESESFQIRSQLSRLESLIANTSRSNSPATPRIAAPPTETPPYRSVSPRDPMFDRLATLVVELKQQVNQLEARVLKLEQKASVTTPKTR